MAKLEQGILGPFRGKVGTVVGYLWRGQAVVRAYVREINYPNTAAQQAERDWFVSMVRFASAVRPALQKGFRRAAAEARMYETNWFVKSNKRHFRTQEDGSVAVDYQRLALSSGSVAPVAAESARVDAEGVLEVRFDGQRQLRRSKAADEVTLVAYNARERKAVIASTVERRTGRVAVRLPDGWQRDELHCYLFAVDAQGEASASCYISTQTSPPAFKHSDTQTFTHSNTQTFTHSNNQTFKQSKPASEAEEVGGGKVAEEFSAEHDKHCPPGI